MNSDYVLSEDFETIQALFRDDLFKVYQVYSYIILWMHYKVEDPHLSNKKNYETYFSSYSKTERYLNFTLITSRNKVISRIANELLDYLIHNVDKIDTPCVLPHMEVLIPLLNDSHTIKFWKFFSHLDAPIGILNVSYT